MNVLVVDDDSLVRQVVCRCLSLEGYQVIEARSATEALAAADRAAALHVVVCDVMLGRESGIDVVRQLIGRRPGLRAMMMSGYPQQLVAPDLPLVWLRKPFGLGDLTTRLDEVLQAPAPPPIQVRIRTRA